VDSLTLEATRYFDDFVTAFSTFEGKVVASLFSYPYLAVDQAGMQSVFVDAQQTAEYFQVHLNNYKSEGCESCSYHSLDVVPVGGGGALATVTWLLKDGNGGEISTWRESYCVLRASGKLYAHTSIDHA